MNAKKFDGFATSVNREPDSLPTGTTSIPLVFGSSHYANNGELLLVPALKILTLQWNKDSK